MGGEGGLCERKDTLTVGSCCDQSAWTSADAPALAGAGTRFCQPPRGTDRKYTRIGNCGLPYTPAPTNHRTTTGETRRVSGISSHSRPSRSLPVFFLFVPPHCLKKKGMPRCTH